MKTVYKRILKYNSIFIVPVLAMVSFLGHGFWAYTLPFLTFVFLPIAEMISEASEENLTKAEEELALEDKYYDWLLWVMVPLQYVVIFLGLYLVVHPAGFFTEFFLASEPDSLFSGKIWLNAGIGWTRTELIGKVIAMGICCGVIGINLAHELGHRVTAHERFMSKALLLTSMYMHFFIEHNKGHHKHVATDHDPASSRRGEILYFFWIRTIIYSYISAWKIEADRLKRAGQPVFSPKNEMIQYLFIQIGFVALIYFIFGTTGMIFFLLAALGGILLLETVNYVEHYGLRRKKTASNNYERVLPIHSWNSNHAGGRRLLFELTRHSDHHYMASRKYQILRHFDESPQMPFGYPAMIVLSTIPPLWFFVMHRRIDDYRKRLPEGVALA